MKIFITSAYSDNIAPEWLWQYNANESLIRVNNPIDADVIIFAESHPGSDPYFRRVHKHLLFRKYPDKCILYHDSDRSISAVKTISPSVEKWQYNPSTDRSAHYIARLCSNHTIDSNSPLINDNRKYLFSFIGGITHKIRKRVLSLEYSESFLKDTTGIHAWQLDSQAKGIYEDEYLRVINDSYFVLCPRGIGPCSYRLFETMQLARVPVIISDQWMPPKLDFDWNEVAIFISESSIEEVPSILESKRDNAAKMGKAARDVWEKHFSPQSSLTTLVDIASQLLQEPLHRWEASKNYLLFLKNPWHLRNLLRYKKNSFNKRLRFVAE